MRRGVGAAVLVCALPFALYGLVLLVYRGEGDGDTYVTIAGHKLDAQTLGAVVLSVALAVIVLAIGLLRRDRAGRRA